MNLKGFPEGNSHGDPNEKIVIPHRPSSKGASSTSSIASVPPMLAFRRAKIWQWQPQEEEQQVIDSIDKRLKERCKADLLSNAALAYAGQEEKGRHRFRRKKKKKNRRNAHALSIVEQTSLRAIVLTQAKKKIVQTIKKIHTAKVRARSSLPFQTVTPSLTPELDDDEKCQIDIFGQVLPENRKYTSPQAVPQFNSMIHKIHNWRQKERPPTPRRDYLKACEDQNILPEKLGIVRPNNAPVLDMTHYGIGPKLQDAFAKGLAAGSFGISDIRLHSNRLNDENGAKLVNSFHDNTLVLDLSQNYLGGKTAAVLGTRFRLSDGFRLKTLDLSNNLLDSNSVKSLCDGIMEASRTELQRLNLSHNNIGSDAGKSISKLFEHDVFVVARVGFVVA